MDRILVSLQVVGYAFWSMIWLLYDVLMIRISYYYGYGYFYEITRELLATTPMLLIMGTVVYV